MKKQCLAAALVLAIATPALAEEYRYEGEKNPWAGVGLSLGAGLLTAPVGAPGIGAGYLYAGKPCKAAITGLGGPVAYFGGFMLGAVAYMAATNTWNSGQNIGGAIFGIGTGIVTTGAYSAWVLTDVYQTIAKENEGLEHEGCF